MRFRNGLIGVIERVVTMLRLRPEHRLIADDHAVDIPVAFASAVALSISFSFCSSHWFIHAPSATRRPYSAASCGTRARPLLTRALLTERV